MSSSQQQQQQTLMHTPSSGGGGGPFRKGKQAKIQQTLQLNKRLHISQPHTTGSSSKSKKYSVIRTIEKQMQALQMPSGHIATLDPSSQDQLNTMINAPGGSSQNISGIYPNHLYTYEPPASQENLIHNINLGNQRVIREENRGYLIRTSEQNQRQSMERAVPSTTTNQRQSSKQRHPSRGHSNNNAQNPGGLIFNSNLAPYLMDHGQNQQPSNQITLQQYSSIPVKSVSATNAQAAKRAAQVYISAAANSGGISSSMALQNLTLDQVQQQQQNHVQLKLLSKQASTLMKMYGNSGNIYRKQYKSVERKAAAPGLATSHTTGGGYSNYKMYQQQQTILGSQPNKPITTSSNSKIQGIDHHHMTQGASGQRKSLGGGINTLNNSVISAINLYDNSLQNLASLESYRQVGMLAQQQQQQKSGMRNLNQSQTYNKFKVKSNVQADSNSFRKARVSSKNVLRYNQHGNTLIRSIQPLEEVKNQFNYESRIQSSSNALQLNRFGGNHHLDKKNSLNNHTNLLIQQNEMYGGADSAGDLLNRSAGEERLLAMQKASNKYQTVTNLSRSAVTSSSRRLPNKHYQESVKQVNNFLSMEQTPQGGAATDTVMYLKQQELVTKSRSAFEEGKKQLLEKNYKEALKSLSLSLKYSPNNNDARYYRAICHLDSDNPKKCIMDLNELIELDPTYNQTIFVVLSIAYRRENDLNSALRALTKGVQKFPKYIEAYQARGQINIYLKKFEKALIDFQHVINLQPYNGAGYIGQADSMKGLGNFKGALTSYNQAISTDMRCRNLALFKRGALLYHLRNYDHSMIDFETLLDDNDRNAKAHYYKGKILKKQEHENEAILHFEQVIKNTTSHLQNNVSPSGPSPSAIIEDGNKSQATIQKSGSLSDEELAGNALFEIAKIRINQKDFYEAFHNLQRAIHYDFRSKKFLQYKMFVEGVLFLMKRKVKKGVKMLTALLDGNASFENASPASPSQEKIGGEKITSPSKEQSSPDTSLVKLEHEEAANLKPYLIHLIHVYRSYGYIITQQYDKALTDLNKASKLKKLDQACIYNRYIAQALIKMEMKDLGGVKSILQQAEIKFPMNKDPYKFQAICIIQGVLNDMVDIDNPKKKQAILDAKSILDRALIKNPKDLSLLYLRGLLLFYLHNFYEALIDLDAVIDLDEEPTAKHYVARGRCHACLSMFQEAIADLTRAIELDEEISDSYFNRGKCAYLLGDTALAFLDFQKLILLEPKNPMVHIYAGNLLMTTGSYDDATKAFTNADSVQKSALAFYQRSRCNIALANMEQALKDLNIVVERSPQDKIAYVDRECLSALKQAIAASSIAQNDLISGSPQTKQGFDSSVFEKAAVTYTKLLNTQYDIESNIHASISAIRQHQQIIPNVKRIKIEKVRALRRKRLKDEQYGGGGMKRQKKVRQAFEVNDSTDVQLKTQAAEVEPFSYYKENIFGQEDFLLYRGIMNFYTGEYQKAVVDFESSIRAKQDQKDHDNNDETISNASNQTDLSDVGLCSLNVHESNYNIVLCYIQLKDYKTALEKVSKLVHDAPKRYSKFLYFIRGLLYQTLGSLSKSKGDIDAFSKLSQQDPSSSSLHSDFFTKKQSIQVNPFPLGTRLCSFFPEVKVNIPQAPTFFYTRPSFSFPFVKPPNMIPNVEEGVLTSEFSLKTAAAPKPEAPWIKRCDYGIKFTDEIQIMEGNNGNPGEGQEVTETELSTNQNEEEEQEQNNSSEDQQHPHHRHERDNHPGQDEETHLHFFQHGDHDNIQQQQAFENERYYLRSYVKEQRRKMLRAYSERLQPQPCDLFRVEDQEEDEEVIINPMEMQEEGIQQQMLYGQQDSAKNIIVDDDEEEEEEYVQE